MTIRMYKWNPSKYNVDAGATELHTWDSTSVPRGTCSGDTIFIGCSGPDASVFAEVEALGDAWLDTSGDVDDMNWLDREAQKQPRFYAKIRFIKSRWPGIPEIALRANSLNRVADFLHSQVALNLSDSEAMALDALL